PDLLQQQLPEQRGGVRDQGPRGGAQYLHLHHAVPVRLPQRVRARPAPRSGEGEAAVRVGSGEEVILVSHPERVPKRSPGSRRGGAPWETDQTMSLHREAVPETASWPVLAPLRGADRCWASIPWVRRCAATHGWDLAPLRGATT